MTNTFELTIRATWQPGFFAGSERLTIGDYSAHANDEGAWQVQHLGSVIAHGRTAQGDVSSAKARAENDIRNHSRLMGQTK